MTREPNKFQFQLIDTTKYLTCSRCTERIDALSDPECAVIWPPNVSGMYFHTLCFGEVLEGMASFFKMFIVDKRKVVGRVQ